MFKRNHSCTFITTACPRSSQSSPLKHGAKHVRSLQTWIGHTIEWLTSGSFPIQPPSQKPPRATAVMIATCMSQGPVVAVADLSQYDFNPPGGLPVPDPPRYEPYLFNPCFFITVSPPSLNFLVVSGAHFFSSLTSFCFSILRHHGQFTLPGLATRQQYHASQLE